MTITTETVNKLYNINLSNFEVEEFLKKQAIEIEDVKNSEDEVLSKEGTDILVIFFPSNYKLIQFIQSINLISAAIDIG